MSSIGIRELRNNLSRVIDRVSKGTSIDVTDHGRVVARLSPPPETDSSLDAFDALLTAGVLLPASQSAKPFVTWPVIKRPRARGGLAAALIDEDRGE